MWSKVDNFLSSTLAGHISQSYSKIEWNKIAAKKTHFYFYSDFASAPYHPEECIFSYCCPRCNFVFCLAIQWQNGPKIFKTRHSNADDLMKISILSASYTYIDFCFIIFINFIYIDPGSHCSCQKIA